MYDPNGTYGFNSINTVACKILNNKFLMNICLTSDCWKVPQDGGGGGNLEEVGGVNIPPPSSANRSPPHFLNQ